MWKRNRRKRVDGMMKMITQIIKWESLKDKTEDTRSKRGSKRNRWSNVGK